MPSARYRHRTYRDWSAVLFNETPDLPAIIGLGLIVVGFGGREHNVAHGCTLKSSPQHP